MSGSGERIKISKLEIFLMAVLLIFGSIMIVMTPLGAGYDEDQHMFRVWQLSNLKMLPEEQNWREAKFPNIYFELSYRKQPLVESVGFDYWRKYGKLKLYDHGYYYRPINSRSRYAPPLLLPQAVALRYSAGRFNLSAMSTYYMTRFAGLLTYIFLAWLAIRLIPFGKWLFTALAIAPMAIYQASTINTDTITNGIGLLFIGGTLHIADKNSIRLKEVGELLILVSILFLSKPNIYPFILLPFLLIPPSKYSKRILYSLLILCTLILFGIEVMGWNLISPNPGFESTGNVNATEQLKYILSNPLAFPKVILNDLRIYGPTYLKQWIGVYGYDYGSVPILTYIFFVIGIFVALFLKDDYMPSRKARLSLLLVFFLCYMATLLSLYLTYTAVGEGFAYGIQGRYYIPIAPLLFLALHGIPSINRFQPSFFSVSLFSLAAVITFTGGLILTYHVTCGSAYYKMETCYQPFYKNFSPLTVSSPPVSEGMVLIQEIVPVCNGMTEIQVRVNSPGSAAGGKTEFTLSDTKENSILAHQVVNNLNLPEDAWYGIDFKPDQHSAGKVYALTIRGTGSSSTDGPLLAYSIKPEYPLGVLFENGKPLEDDIIFRYGCLVGIKKFWNELNP